MKDAVAMKKVVQTQAFSTYNNIMSKTIRKITRKPKKKRNVERCGKEFIKCPKAGTQCPEDVMSGESFCKKCKRNTAAATRKQKKCLENYYNSLPQPSTPVTLSQPSEPVTLSQPSKIITLISFPPIPRNDGYMSLASHAIRAGIKNILK